MYIYQLHIQKGKTNEALESDAHLIGKRWHYSKNTKDNTDSDVINGGVSGDWYICTKYRNIKRELLDNKIYAISMNAWIFNYDRCVTIMKTEKAKKTIKAMGDRWKTFYDDNQDFKDLPDPDIQSYDRRKSKDMFKKQSEDNTIDINQRITITIYSRLCFIVIFMN